MALQVRGLLKHVNGRTHGRWMSSKPGGSGNTQTVSNFAAQTPAKHSGSAEARAAELSRRLMKQRRQTALEEEEKRNVQYENDYKRATRKWISTMIALPIAIVTSYYLFDRLALGNQPKKLPNKGTAA